MPGTNALSSSDVKHRTIQLLLLLAIYVFPSSSSSFLSIGRLPVFLPFIFLRSLTIPPFLIFLRRSIRRLRCLLFQLYFLFSTLFLMVCCQLFMIPFGSLILYLFIFSHFSFCYLFSFPPPLFLIFYLVNISSLVFLPISPFCVFLFTVSEPSFPFSPFSSLFALQSDANR